MIGGPMPESGGSSDLHLAIQPAEGYSALIARDARTSWRMALHRPLLGALLVGVSVAIAATGRASPAVVLSATMAWSWVMVVQFAIALVMTRPLPRDGSVSAARAFELWFAGHVPWTLWVLTLAPLLRVAPETPVELLLVSTLVPMAWTATIAAAFGRVVLRQSERMALMRAGLHQLVLLGVILSYAAWAAGGWFRIVG
jgi:hypothetical protein